MADERLGISVVCYSTAFKYKTGENLEYFWDTWKFFESQEDQKNYKQDSLWSELAESKNTTIVGALAIVLKIFRMYGLSFINYFVLISELVNSGEMLKFKVFSSWNEMRTRW